MGSLVEVRLLDGPSPDLVAPSVRLTLDLPLSVSRGDAEHLLRSIAVAANYEFTGPTASRIAGDGLLVLSYPWRDSASAEALGEALAAAVDSVAAGTSDAEAISAAAETVSRATSGEAPRVIEPHVPSVAITGTNGKTTTTRLIGHIASAAGKSAAWSSTDGVFVNGRCIDEGDWSGPGGARMVLEQPIDIAVLETARGGLMTRGMGVSAVDATVVTNVTDDHLGLHGIDTLDQLAWVKATPVRIVRPEGWAILNADDPLVLRMAEDTPGQVWLTSLNPAVVDHLGSAEPRARRVTTVIGGRVVVKESDAEDLDLGAIVDMPLTLAGLSKENISNVLGAASGALALGLPADSVREGLRTFAPDLALNPGRMNIFSYNGATIICDFAHNEAGTDALLRVAQGLLLPEGRLRFAIGNAGDRTDENIRGVARMTGAVCDQIYLAAKPAYLRGRTQEDIDRLQREGLTQVGAKADGEFDDEVSCMSMLIDSAAADDVIGFMVHEQRDEIFELLDARGATPDDPAAIRAKAEAVRSRS